MFERDHKVKIAEGESYAPYEYHYADDIDEDGVTDPISLMKHGKQRHEDIIKRRRLKRDQPKEKSQPQKEKKS